MYYEIHRMCREGHSVSQISNYLVLNRRTVSKYLAMSEQEYEDFLRSQENRKKVLGPYEKFIKERLEQYPETSAAQMHDWLKEFYPDFPKPAKRPYSTLFIGCGTNIMFPG
jgi:predicted transcriptional regulator